MSLKARYDLDRLDAIASAQFGVIGRAQAVASGLNPSSIDYLIGPAGRWQRMLPGVYVMTNSAVSADQREMAALLHVGEHGVITGAAAVRRHHLRCAGLNQVDVLVPEDVRVHSVGFVHVIRTTRMPDETYSTRQLRFVPLDRAVADAAREMSRLSDVRAVVAEAVQRGRCEIPSLVRELNDGPSAGSRLFRIALREIGDGVRSAAEADLKSLIDRSNIEKPIYNARLYATDGTFLGIADAWWQRAGVAAEVDSREYHLSPEDYQRTTERHNRMAAHGINVLHFLPSAVRRKSPSVLADLRSAIETGNRRPPIAIIVIPATPNP
jgi:hypothetical protein